MAFWRWVSVALCLRIIASLTRSHWDQPDEWFQTLELARIVRGVPGIFSQEVELHLRNLTHPALLGLFLKIGEWFVGLTPRAPLAVVQIASSAWSMGFLFAARALAAPKRLPQWSYALLALTPFWLIENTKPSAENWAAACFAWALVALARQSRGGDVLGGILLLGVGAIKYPAGLLSLGALIALARQVGPRVRLARIAMGCSIGIVLFGLADAWIYGAPWESAVAYLQYNVFTALGRESFGSQSALVYVQHLANHWLKLFLPVTLALVPFWVASIRHALPRSEAWFWAFLFYGAGHLLVAHKEGRFLVPLEGLLLLTAAIGFQWQTDWTRWPRWKARAAWALTAALGFSTVPALRGDLWKPYDHYFEIANASPELWSDACALITPRRMHSFILPTPASPEKDLAVGVSIGERLAWDRTPSCRARSTLIVQLSGLDPSVADHIARDCPPIEGMPHWRACPANALAAWEMREVHFPYVDRFASGLGYPRPGERYRAEFLDRRESVIAHRPCSIDWCGSR